MPDEPLQSAGSGLSPRGEPSYNFDDNFDLNPEPRCSAELGPVIEKCKRDPNNIPRGHFINASEDGGRGSKEENSIDLIGEDTFQEIMVPMSDTMTGSLDAGVGHQMLGGGEESNSGKSGSPKS